jgi:hypothetical protein
MHLKVVAALGTATELLFSPQYYGVLHRVSTRRRIERRHQAIEASGNRLTVSPFSCQTRHFLYLGAVVGPGLAGTAESAVIFVALACKAREQTVAAR